MVDWKKIPKIDAHIHLLPQDVIDANKGYSDRFVDYGVYDSYLITLGNIFNLSYSEKASVTWTPKVSGIYKLTVYVKDATGDVASKEMFFSVAKKQLYIKTFKFTPKTAKVNKAVKAAVTAANKSGTAYYKFVVKNSKNKTVSSTKYLKTKVFSWKPTAKGKYKVTVYVKDGRNTYIKSTKTITVK